jgi:hypothetical protein
MVLLNGLITNDKFCFVRTSQVKLHWAHRPRHNSPQAAAVATGYLSETPRLAGGTYEAPVANPPSVSASHQRSAALGPGLSVSAGVGAAVATFEQKRALVELLIDRVLVANGEVEIRYVLPTHPRSEKIRFCHLRKDYSR